MTLRVRPKAMAPGWLRLACKLSRDVRDAYVTLGDTVYVPVMTSHLAPLPERVIVHEAIHAEQWRRWPRLYPWLYALLPIPWLGYFRYRFEAQAYGAQVVCKQITAERAADLICSRLYLWPWPRALVLKRLRRFERS